MSLLCGAGTPGPPHSSLCFLIKVRIYSGILLNHKKNQIMSSEAVWMDLSGCWTNHDTTWDVLYVLRQGENRDFVWAPCCLGSGDGERNLSPGDSWNWVPCGTAWGPFFRVIMTGLKGRIPQAQRWGPAVGSGFASTGFHQHLCQGRQEARGQCRGHFCRIAWCFSSFRLLTRAPNLLKSPHLSGTEDENKL